MAHEITRILRAASASAWFIEPTKAAEIVALLELRAAGQTGGYAAADRPEPKTRGSIAVLPLVGTITPRADMLSEMSGARSLASFQRDFQQVADDDKVSAIVIEVDSPGGQVDLVPETAAMIRAARRDDRPIVAIANTMAASAAYWIASAADELVATPSALVGSIGVFTMHQDVSEALAKQGVSVSFISAGPRKVEGNPFEPLGAEARASLQAHVSEVYDLFTADVARARGVTQAVVKADPEKAERHMGGGRVVSAAEGKRLGMVDRVETLPALLARLGKRRSASARRRLALS